MALFWRETSLVEKGVDQKQPKMTDAAVAGEWSASGESDVEGEEEPLFADDLEDLPPLPPPMPSLAQLQEEESNVSSSLFHLWC